MFKYLRGGRVSGISNANEGLIESGLQKEEIRRASDHVMFRVGHARAEASSGGLGES